VRGFLAISLSKLRGTKTGRHGPTEISREVGRDDRRSSQLSIVGTALLSVACLIVLMLQWERTGCVEGRDAGGECFSDVRPHNTRTPAKIH